MGIFLWLLGHGDKPARSGQLARISGTPGRFDVDVAGESRYQSALAAICGGATKTGHRLEVDAQLVLETNDPHDPNAVWVQIEGQTVGFLDRETARNFRNQLREAGVVKGSVTCDAIIVGGWDRGGGNRGYFGVKLNLPSRGTQATVLPFRSSKPAFGPSKQSRLFGPAPKRRQEQQRRPKERGPWRPQSWRLITPWFPMAALVAVAAVSYFGGEAFWKSSGRSRNEIVAPALVSGEASDSEIVGRASVVDGDTLEIHGERIRLHGIDAPESGQLCSNMHGQTIRCGQRAALALSDKIGNSTVTCEPRDRDSYGRVVAICHAGGEDLNRWMVAQGWAMAYRKYSTAYAEEEQQASAAKLGMWQGDFEAPWDWRRDYRSEGATVQSSSNCVVKGNINNKGQRIYHVPGGEYYSQTGINPSKGERWFCSEAEARAAGWRRSLR